MKLITLLTLLSLNASASCIIWEMTPMKPDKNGCVGWNWRPVPASATNCVGLSINNGNPLARQSAADPQDCIYMNHGGNVINLCR